MTRGVPCHRDVFHAEREPVCPHRLCTYPYELAARTLRQGLDLSGIAVVDRM